MLITNKFIMEEGIYISLIVSIFIIIAFVIYSLISYFLYKKLKRDMSQYPKLLGMGIIISISIIILIFLFFNQIVSIFVIISLFIIMIGLVSIVFSKVNQNFNPIPLILLKMEKDETQNKYAGWILLILGIIFLILSIILKL